jgi:hypothetical protein
MVIARLAVLPVNQQNKGNQFCQNSMMQQGMTAWKIQIHHLQIQEMNRLSEILYFSWFSKLKMIEM